MPKIVAVMGSPHVGGNIATAVDILLEAASEGGADCVRYDLCRKNIQNCLGCRRCVENGGECVVKDDFKEIFEEIKKADTVIIGSPIYICQVNGFTKTFLDRLYPLTDVRHKPRFGKRNVVMLCTYGAPVPFIFSGYIRKTGRSLKAMGLCNKQNIVIPGCFTQESIQNNKRLQQKLKAIGRRIGS